MPKALIILHAAPDAADCRALTALRLAGALLADGKEVHLFMVEDGARLADPKLGGETTTMHCSTSCLMPASTCRSAAER